jgi:hypothetical protein
MTNTMSILSFTVSGIQNPRSLSLTDSFKIYTEDSYGNIIDYKDDQMTVLMTSTYPITSA